MKTQVLFGVIFAILLVGVRCSSEEEDDWSSEEEGCVNELRLNKENMRTLNNQEIVPEDNDDFNSFLHCYWQSKGIQNADGVVNFKKLHKEFISAFQKKFGKNPAIEGIIAGDMIKRGIDDCDEEKVEGSTHGAKMAKLQNCVVNKIKKAIDEISAETE